MARVSVFVRTSNNASIYVSDHRLEFSTGTKGAHWGSIAAYMYEDRYELVFRATDGTEIGLTLDTKALLALKGMIEELIEERLKHMERGIGFGIYDFINSVYEQE